MKIPKINGKNGPNIAKTLKINHLRLDFGSTLPDYIRPSG